MQELYIVEVSLSSAGGLNLNVYDSENYEEYIRAHILRTTGAFPGEIHKACKGITQWYFPKIFFHRIFQEGAVKKDVALHNRNILCWTGIPMEKSSWMHYAFPEKPVAVMGNVCKKQIRSDWMWNSWSHQFEGRASIGGRPHTCTYRVSSLPYEQTALVFNIFR